MRLTIALLVLCCSWAQVPHPPGECPVCWGYGFVTSEGAAIPGHKWHCVQSQAKGGIYPYCLSGGCPCGGCNFYTVTGTGSTCCPKPSTDASYYMSMDECVRANCGSTSSTPGSGKLTCVHGVCGKPDKVTQPPSPARARLFACTRK